MVPPFAAHTVLFDLDGTLVDSAPDLGAAADQMRVARGLPSLPLSAYRPVAGAGARGLLGVAFGITPADPGFDALRSEFFDLYEARLTEQTTAFDGIAELLQALQSRGLAWGVVTNKAERFARPLVLGMPELSGASVLICGDTTPHPKPHPAPLLEAVRRLGVAPTGCIYVGDDLRDVQAGHAAGMATVAAAYGYLGRDAEATTWGAHALINSPADLLKLITPV